MYDIYLIHADGTGLTAIASGANPEWFAPLPGRPEAAFTHGCSGTACTFDGLGSADYDGRIVSYAWQFGDGTSGTGATPSHTYTRGDNYTATLTVTDNAGATGVVSMRVHANAPPSASFTAACVGPTCSFDGTATSDSDGTIASYYWFFGDGETAAGLTATHTYVTGTFTVSLYVVDNAGGIDIRHQTVTVVNAPPVAVFTRTCNGLALHASTASGSSDPDGTIARYSWSFGDGTTSPWGASMASHSYAAAGTYTVTLTVTGNNYGTGTQSQTFSVASRQCSAGRLVHVRVRWTLVQLQRVRFLGSRRDDRELRLELRRWDDRFWCDGESHLRGWGHLHGATDRDGQRWRDHHLGPECHGRCTTGSACRAISTARARSSRTPGLRP